MLETDFNLIGLEEVLGKLDSLQWELRYKGGRFAMRKAAKVVLTKAKDNALRLDDPKTAESIYKNIVLRFSPKKFKETRDLHFRIGVLGGAQNPESRRNARRRSRGAKSLKELGEIAGKGKGNPGGDTWYWRLLEYGTSKMAASPFLRPALYSSKAEVILTFIHHFNKAIDRALKRVKKGKVR